VQIFSSKCIINNLFLFIVFKNNYFSIRCGCRHSFILKPNMICINVSVFWDIELCMDKKSIFLRFPKFPMLWPWSTDYMALIWLETNLAKNLFTKVILPNNSALIFSEPFPCNCFCISTFNNCSNMFWIKWKSNWLNCFLLSWLCFTYVKFRFFYFEICSFHIVNWNEGT